MDQITFIGDEKSIVNYINCAEYDANIDEFPPIFEEKLREAFETMPKLRYKISEVAGDFYYEMMSVEETIKKGFIIEKDGFFKNQDDLDRFG